MKRPKLSRVLLVLAALGLAIQLVPYGWKWPLYSRIAPVSWLVYNDIQEGREHLNVSEWNRPQKDAHEAAEELQKGAMPLPIYLPLHPEARLSPAEKAELVAGLAATLGGEGEGAKGGPTGGEGGEGGDDDDD